MADFFYSLLIAFRSLLNIFYLLPVVSYLLLIIFTRCLLYSLFVTSNS